LKGGINLLFLLAIVGLAGTILYKQNPGVTSARIQFVQKKMDLGILPDFKKVPYVFRFQNLGQSELVIHDVRTSCGCTAALAQKNRFRPGEWGTIQGTLDTVGKSGLIEERVYVVTNEDLLDPIHELVLTGSAQPSPD